MRGHSEASRGPLPPETLRFIFRELMSSSRSLQRQLRVACLGPKYSYSHLASVARFGESVEHVPLGSIAAVFEEVARRNVHFGIVPLENSTDGRIADTLDMFVSQPGLKIRAEVRLRVRHCLVGLGEWSEVRRVYSKAQAISQCRNWLGKNLPQATTVDVVSSAEAAAIASTDPEAAAIASKPAADAHGLKILVENIEDQANNTTRFAVISERGERPTGRDKTTLILRLINSAGSLARAIAPFEENGVNMDLDRVVPHLRDDQPTQSVLPVLRRRRRAPRRRGGRQGARRGSETLRPARNPRFLPSERKRRKLIGGFFDKVLVLRRVFCYHPPHRKALIRRS